MLSFPPITLFPDPDTLMLEPSRAAARMLKLEPMLRKSATDVDAPQRANERHERLEPRFTKSSTLLDFIFTLPWLTDRPDPRRVNALHDRLLPQLTKLSADNALPHLIDDLIEIDEPRAAH